MDEYSVIGKSGEGAHGIVLKAKHLPTGKLVALKKIPLRRLQETLSRQNEDDPDRTPQASMDGLPLSTLREIKALQSVHHPNIVELRDVFAHGAAVTLVFEFVTSDLSHLLRHAVETVTPLRKELVQHFMIQLLRGVAHLHEKRLFHRDLKPGNLLLTADGILKIADFGLARIYNVASGQAKDGPADYPEYDWREFGTATDFVRKHGTELRMKQELQSQDKENILAFSHQVATRWYRSPELLYGAKHYDQGVDSWSIGCILGEMINNGPLFPGQHDIDQLFRIQRILGTPTETLWPQMKSLPDYHKISFPEMTKMDLQELLYDAETLVIDLLERFLQYDSSQRLSASNALEHDYFKYVHAEKKMTIPVHVSNSNSKPLWDFQLKVHSLEIK